MVIVNIYSVEINTFKFDGNRSAFANVICTNGKSYEFCLYSNYKTPYKRKLPVIVVEYLKQATLTRYEHPNKLYDGCDGFINSALYKII